MSSVVLSSMLLGLSALGLSTAQIQLPEELETRSDRLGFTGFGGRNKGSFQLHGDPAYHGEFRRSESRLGVFDPLYVSSKGKSSFTMRSDGTDEAFGADCQMKKGSVTIDVVTFDPRKMYYQCDFRKGGKLLGARLVLGQPKADGFKEKFLALDRRRGESNIFDQHLTIESVHDYKGTKLSSQPPIGYLLRHDGEAVAAIELTDVNPTLFVSHDLPSDLRRSVIVTALALAILRDPANSALDD